MILDGSLDGIGLLFGSVISDHDDTEFVTYVHGVPELPEVETVRRQLARAWQGATIERAFFARPNYFFVTTPRTLKARLMGRRLIQLQRWGKYLIAHFEDEGRLLLHLGMTGQFSAGSVVRDAHVHMIFGLSNRKEITFRDVRKFGKVEWIAPGKTSKRLEKLGPDALIVESPLLFEKFRKRNIPIKTALLDQSIWAGVGNIYADEALFLAGLRPTKEASRLNQRQVTELCQHVQALLQRSIEYGGSTINDYIQPDGELGGFQDFHQVYGKTTQPCPRCRTAIERIVLAGRSSHYCPRCQR